MELKDNKDATIFLNEEYDKLQPPHYRELQAYPDTYNKNLICYLTLDDELEAKIVDVRELTECNSITKYIIDFPLVLDQDFKQKQIIWDEKDILTFKEYCKQNIKEEYIIKEVCIHTVSELAINSEPMLHSTWIAERKVNARIKIPEYIRMPILDSVTVEVSKKDELKTLIKSSRLSSDGLYESDEFDIKKLLFQIKKQTIEKTGLIIKESIIQPTGIFSAIASYVKKLFKL